MSWPGQQWQKTPWKFEERPVSPGQFVGLTDLDSSSPHLHCLEIQVFLIWTRNVRSLTNAWVYPLVPLVQKKLAQGLDRLPAWYILYVHYRFLSSKVNNMLDISYFVQWPWKWGQRSNSRSRKYSAYIICYKFTIDSRALKSILSELLAVLTQRPWEWGQRSN